MREERTRDEELTDDALILSLYAMAQDKSRDEAVGDRLKAMKLVFLANHTMFQERAKGLNCTFYRWDLGPMSNQVYAAWDRLMAAGLIIEEEELVVTRKGIELAKSFVSDVLKREENHFFLKVIDSVAEQWGDKSRNDILDAVYGMETTPVRPRIRTTIADAPRSAHFTEALDAREAQMKLQIPEEWLETFAVALQPSAALSIERAVDDVHAGRVVESDEVWSFLDESPAI